MLKVYGVDIDVKEVKCDILPFCQIYIDESSNKTLREIKTLKDQFQKNSKTRLEYGYSPTFTVWVKFTLQNTSNEKVTKILKYNHPLTTDISLYDGEKVIKEGLYHVSEHRSTVTPTFKIQLEANSTKEYYFELRSHILPLVVDLKLCEEKFFDKEETKHKMVLSLFFGAMGVLFIYNFFIFLFTKDRSYLYYILYIFGVSLHHGLYTGVLYIFLPPSIIPLLAVEGIYGVISLFLIGLILFIKSFLQISQYPKLDKVLNILFVLMLFATLGSIFGLLNGFESIIFLIIALYLVFISIYAALKRNRQAYFIVVGWSCIFLSFLLLVISNNGLFDIFGYYRYTIETGLFLEAMIFSIALADRINQLQSQKILLNNKLIEQQKTEEKRLNTLVEEKTKELNEALEDKEVLFQELHHRVKNNMQTVISLLRLQSAEIEDNETKGICITAQNRINSISQLHELLYDQNSVSQVDTREYFTKLIDQIKRTLKVDKNISIQYNIQASFSISYAITCGLILNELITNSYKYAFKHEGIIDIKLYKKDDEYFLIIKDNGKGYDRLEQNKSLGLKIINILVTKQLKGTIQTKLEDGVENIIRWKDEEK